MCFSGSETILVVDDNVAILRLITDILTKSGYSVHAASSPEEARRIFSSLTPIPLLISDVMMPRECGPDLAEAFLAHQPGSMVLFVSGYENNALVAERVVAKRLPLLIKPFTLSALLARVRELLNAAKVRKAAGSNSL